MVRNHRWTLYFAFVKQEFVVFWKIVIVFKTLTYLAALVVDSSARIWAEAYSVDVLSVLVTVETAAGSHLFSAFVQLASLFC